MSERDFVLGKDEVFLLLPPQPVAGDIVRQVEWSPSGSAVCAVRTLYELAAGPEGLTVPDTSGESVVVWNRKTKRSQEVFRTGRTGRVTETAWLTGSDLLFFTVEELDRTTGNIRRTLLRSSASGSSAVPVRHTTNGDSEMWGLYASAFDPVAVHIQTSLVTEGGLTQAPPAQRAVATVFRGNGTISNGIPLDPGYRPGMVLFGRGGVAYLSFRAPGSRDTRWVELQTNTGVLTPMNRRPELPSVPEPRHRFKLVPKKSQPESALPSLMLDSEDSTSSALVAADTATGEISPDGTAVLYVTQGVALVRPLLTVPRKAYEDARRAAQRTMAMSNGKQAGLALIMFAADHDDELPGPSPNFNERLMPYLKNSSILDSFTYTFKGGKMSDIKAPAETVLGYVNGPGGRAVVYADGHVRWVND